MKTRTEYKLQELKHELETIDLIMKQLRDEADEILEEIDKYEQRLEKNKV